MNGQTNKDRLCAENLCGRETRSPADRLGAMDRAALYYPFHLCSRECLEHLLSRYTRVHFRDYMALQMTPMSGTTAFPDRISDQCPDLYTHGRIVQGHRVSGPLNAEMGRRIDRDVADRDWREMFHSLLRSEPRFRRGFADRGEDAAQFASWRDERWTAYPISLAEVRRMSCLKLDPERALAFEYGLMLVKTSAALWYTIQFCRRHALEAATDSPAHDRLLNRILTRDLLQVTTYLWRQGPE
jgi:hypothetical protein